MDTIDLMKEVMAVIEKSFTHIPDNRRTYQINYVDYVVSYTGWYDWHCLERDADSSDSFETLAECLQDAMEFERQARTEAKLKAEEEADDLLYGTYEEQKLRTYYSLTRG